MRVINVSLNELETKVLLIGFEGENQITQVRIDAAEILTDYPNATPTLIVKPLFGFAYPVIVTQEGTDVVWEIDNSVLSFHGDGEIQLTFTSGSVIAKSYVGRIRIKRSLAVNGEKPDPIETWEQAATAKLAEVDAQIGELEDMVEAAEAAKDQAQDIVDDAAADIQAAGQTQIAAVEAKGEEVRESIPSDYSTLSGDVSGLKSALTAYGGGTTGQILRKKSNADNDVEWASVGQPTDEQVANAVDDWLDEHPEATTTVDFSIATKVFPTVSDMVADLTLENGDNVATRGYYASGDNGGTNYVVSSSHTGVFYITLSNGLYANLLEEKKLISADIIGAKHYSTRELAEADTAGAELNHTIIQNALSNNFSVLFGVGYYAFSDYIEMYPASNIFGAKREWSRLVFPYSMGLRYLSYNFFQNQHIKDLTIYSLGDCINVDAAVANVINCSFDYLSLNSTEGECIVAPRLNRGARQGDTCVWSCYFGHINGASETGAIFANITGLGNWFYYINVSGNTQMAFRNCSGTVQRVDTNTTKPYYCFYYDDVQDYALSLLLIDVHYEGCNRSFIYTEDSTASTMAIGIMAIDSGVSNLDPYIQEPLTTPFIKVGTLSYLYHYGKYIMNPPESYYDMEELHDAIYHVYIYRASSPNSFKTNIGGTNGLKIYSTYAQTTYTFYGGYTNEQYGIGPYGFVPRYGRMYIDSLEGGRKHQTIYITDEDLPSGTGAKLINVTNIDKNKRYCDRVVFTLTADSTNTTIRNIEIDDACDGRTLVVQNSRTSTKNIVLEDATGYTTSYGFGLSGNLTIAPGTSVCFILNHIVSNNNILNRWYVIPSEGNIVTVSGATPAIVGVKDTRYMCGTVTSLNITPPNKGTIEVFFTSGATPATVKMPRTVYVPSWFDPSNLSANTKYRIQITDCIYGEVEAFVEQPLLNLLDPDEFTDGSVWWKGSMVSGASYVNHCATPKIQVTPETTYILRRDSGQQNMVCYFDENQSYLSQAEWYDGATKTIPSGVYYVGITILKTDKENALFAEY